MSKKVLVISTSPRKNGNSDALAEEFAKGAREAGNDVEKICLHDKTIGFCKGCFACHVPQRAVQGLEGWIRCFPKACLAGTVFGGGADAVGDIKGNPALREAFDLGRTA